jgi:NAD(P)-dependent dehydrogenase (short-subunit alcohol dehydrogenase family)
MELDGKVAIVTGGGRGIGSSLAVALTEAGAKVMVADLDGERARVAVSGLPASNAMSMAADVTDSAALGRLIEAAERELGPVDLFFANAGVATGIDLGSSEEEWKLSLDVNLMAHVRAARLLVPRWLERGGGYFVATASAAGLLTQIGSAPYATTKHAAVAFAEWLSITYGERGIRVSCLCPMGVRTPMLDTGFGATKPEGSLAVRTVTAAGAVLEPDEVARITVRGIEGERFLILPHPEVLDFFQRKGADYEHWLSGMRRLQREADLGDDLDQTGASPSG